MPNPIITTLLITHTPVDDKHSTVSVKLDTTGEGPVTVTGSVLEAMFDTYISFLREHKVTIGNILSTIMANFAETNDNGEVHNG